MVIPLFGSSSLRKESLLLEKEAKAIRKKNSCNSPCDCVGVDTSQLLVEAKKRGILMLLQYVLSQAPSQ